MPKYKKLSAQNKWLTVVAILFVTLFIYGAMKMIFAPVSINEMTVSTSRSSLSKSLLYTSPIPRSTCRPRPACLDSNPPCMLPETDDMCPSKPKSTSTSTPASCRQTKFFGAQLCNGRLVFPTSPTR